MSEDRQNGAMHERSLSQEERLSALFAGLVVHQAQLALMLLGRLPHPSTGETTTDLTGAKLFIDQLEMLEEKTKGNLSAEERKLLRDNLTALRMAFVEATAEPSGPSPAPTSASGSGDGSPAGSSSPASVASDSSTRASAEGDSRKKFTKKY